MNWLEAELEQSQNAAEQEQGERPGRGVPPEEEERGEEDRTAAEATGEREERRRRREARRLREEREMEEDLVRAEQLAEREKQEKAKEQRREDQARLEAQQNRQMAEAVCVCRCSAQCASLQAAASDLGAHLTGTDPDMWRNVEAGKGVEKIVKCASVAQGIFPPAGSSSHLLPLAGSSLEEVCALKKSASPSMWAGPRADSGQGLRQGGEHAEG